MQNLNSPPGQDIDIAGHKVCVGSRVNVRWKGEWYVGQVIKLGPKRNLCRIKDLSSDQTLLLEPQQVKFTQTHVLDKRLLPGSHVAYNDREKWLEGVIVTSSAVGVLQVSWRKSVRAPESQNWFEIADVAPDAHDEAYLERNRDELAAGRSGLLHNDAVEPRPRTMENALFDPTEDEVDMDMVDRIPPRSSLKHNGGIPMSPTYEDIEEEIHKADRARHRPLPSPPLVSPHLDQITDPWLSASPSFTPSHSIQPTQLSMAYPHITPYAASTWGMGESMVSNSVHPSFLIPHPKPAPDKNLEQSTLPCALSYQPNCRNGIPPHRSSNFFKRTVALPGHMTRDTDSDIFGHSVLKTSPSILSRAVSEPASNFGTLPVIPRREKKRNRFFSASKKQQQQTKPKTTKNTKTTKKPEPLPYEVPTKPKDLITVIEEESKDDELTAMLVETESVPRPQTSTPKKKPGAPVISSASPSLLSVNIGENILITCTANGKASLTYEWYKDGEKLPGKARNVEELSPGKLEIQKVRQEDEGMYRCVVKNKHGSDNRYFRLNVTIQYTTPTKRMIQRSPHRSRRSKKMSKKSAAKEQPKKTIPPSKTPIHQPETSIGPPQLTIDPPQTPTDLQQTPVDPHQTPIDSLQTPIDSLQIPTDLPEEEDEAVKKFLSDLVEDIEIPEIEFSVGNGNEEEKTIEGGEDLEVEKINLADDNGLLESYKDEDELTDIPEIASAPDRKLKLPRRVSIGNKAVGDVDQYLTGYGEDYGSKSSTTDLELEGLKYYKEREIKKRVAARDKGKQPSRDSSPTKTTDEDEEKKMAMSSGFKGKSKKLLNFSKFTRKNKKKTTEVEAEAPSTPPSSRYTHHITPPHGGDVTRPPHTNDVTPHHNDVTPIHNDVTDKTTAFVIPQIVVGTPRLNGERDSIAVNTSLGGTDSEDTLIDEAAADKIKGHVHLPLESLPVSDRVRLLQQSVREHNPNDFVMETSRKKGFFSGIFSKGRNTTT